MKWIIGIVVSVVVIVAMGFGFRWNNEAAFNNGYVEGVTQSEALDRVAFQFEELIVLQGVALRAKAANDRAQARLANALAISIERENAENAMADAVNALIPGVHFELPWMDFDLPSVDKLQWIRPAEPRCWTPPRPSLSPEEIDRMLEDATRRLQELRQPSPIPTDVTQDVYRDFLQATWGDDTPDEVSLLDFLIPDATSKDTDGNVPDPDNDATDDGDQ